MNNSKTTYERDWTAFKSENTFLELASKLGYNIQAKGGKCPACGRKNTFSITPDKIHYKCFRPSCKLNKSGDIFNFVQVMGMATSFPDAVRLICGDYQLGSRSRYTKRHVLMSKVFELYRKAYQLYPRAKEYLRDRNLENVLNLEVGYAPPISNYLIDNLGSYEEELIEELLIMANRCDVLYDRLVFPIRNNIGHLVHFHSRSLDEKQQPKWKATVAPQDIKPNTYYAWNMYNLLGARNLFITEGIPDCLSLSKLGIAAVGALSINADFSEVLSASTVTNLVAMFDNDTYAIGHRYSGRYKSWESVIPSLITYQQKHPEVKVWCALPPHQPGVKDINELVNYYKDYENSKDIVLNIIKQRTKSLFSFCLDYYKDRPKEHLHILKALKFDSSSRNKKALANWIDNNYSDPIDYFVSVIE